MNKSSNNSSSAATAADAAAEPESGPAQPSSPVEVQGASAAGSEQPAAALPDVSYEALDRIITVQSGEIARLSAENARLLDRIETFLQIQQREQVLRQQLQSQVERFSERAGIPGAGPSQKSFEKSLRDEVTEDIKPVLLAILDLLERAVPHQDVAPQAAAPSPAAPLSAPAEPFQKLPDILTRPLEDLVGDVGLEPESQKLRSCLRLKVPSAATAAQPARAPQPPEPAPTLPGIFNWTIFLSNSRIG